MTALEDIDAVVADIKAAADISTAKTVLRDHFKLSEPQADAIIEMRLGRLTNLESGKLKGELEELKVRITHFKGLLGDEGELRSFIKDETAELAQRYGDARRTEIVDGEVETINVEDLIKKEEMMILISNLGYVKRVPVSSYRNQGRGGKGMMSAKLAEEEFVAQIFVASTHEYIMFITSAGRAFWMKVHELPEGSRTTKGAHIRSLLPIAPDEDITTIVSLKDFSEEQYLFMATSRAVVKRVKTSEFVHAKTRGIIAISLDAGDTLVSTLLTVDKDEVVLISKQGQALRTNSDRVRAMGRSGHGVAGMKLDADDALAGVLRVVENEAMLLLSEYGYGKRVDFSEFSAHRRGTGGQRIYTVSEKTGVLVGCTNVREDEDLMCITVQGK
jgi:DNA gyrase subunit A